MRLRPTFLAILLLLPGTVRSDPLSRRIDVDFFHDVRSRDLRGLATRSDGRLVGGPSLVELRGEAPAELLWCLEPTPGGKWLAGTGPNGRIAEISPDLADGTYASREAAKLDDPEVFAVRRLADGSILAGTSPKGGLCLVREGKLVARVGLPVDSIFDLLVLRDGTALAATGNPGRIYRIDLAKFAASGVTAEKVADLQGLSARGITVFGEIHDRNVRRIARLADGRIAAGSAPKGNLYLFGRNGGAPLIAQENRDAEVTDLLPDSNGGFYASLVFSPGENHLVPSAGKHKEAPPDTPTGSEPAQIEKFGGRSTLQWFPADGFPETLTTRSGVAFYRLARFDELLIIAGGEQGELSGYDLAHRLALTFAGSASAQVNGLEPVAGSPGRFLALRNNAPGFALLDFKAPAAREAETRPIDLGAPARLGALRFSRPRNFDESRLSVSVSTSNGSDEAEGWSPWVAMRDDDGWRGAEPRGRFVKLRLRLPAAAPVSVELDKAALFFLPQNHPPVLEDFRLLSPNYAVVVPADSPAPVTTTVAQLLQAGDHDSDRHHNAFLGSQIVPSPGTRVAFWTAIDPDGDNLSYTFSIRRDGDAAWTDVSIDSRDSYAQFDTAHLPEGVYFTRLVAKQAAPRPEAERLSTTFETDDLVVDHTPPQILDASARRAGARLVVTVHGRDALSLLDSLDAAFNNGVHATVEQPADGILDGKEETFVLEEPLANIAGATSVEVTLYDAAGNGSTRRLSW